MLEQYHPFAWELHWKKTSLSAKMPYLVVRKYGLGEALLIPSQVFFALGEVQGWRTHGLAGSG